MAAGGWLGTGDIPTATAENDILAVFFQSKLTTLGYPLSWYWLFFLPLAAAAVAARKKPELWAGFAVFAAFIISESQVFLWLHHYFAVLLGLLLLLGMEGFYLIKTASGKNGARLVGIIAVLMIAISYTFQALGEVAQENGERWALDREDIIRKLEKLPGGQLVLVSYAKDHSIHEEWVYNGADIDGSKVLFAHSLPNNGPLLQYFKNRKVWDLNVGAEKYTLSAEGP